MQPIIKSGQLDVGTGANQLVQLDGSGNLPAVGGANITGLDAATLSGQTLGTGSSDIVQLNASAQLPAVDGSLLTSINAATLSGQSLGTGPNNVLQLTGTGQLPAINGALLTSINAATLSGQPVGVGANDIVQLNASAQLPAVDGSLLTGISTASVFSGAVVTTASATGLSNGANTVVGWDTESIDTNGFHVTSGATERLTIPSGITKVKVKFFLEFSANVNGQRTAQIRKNGGFGPIGTNIAAPQFWAVANDIGTLAPTTIYGETPVIDVISGTYFDLRVGVFNATGWTNGSDGITSASWFTVEVIQ